MTGVFWIRWKPADPIPEHLARWEWPTGTSITAYSAEDAVLQAVIQGYAMIKKPFVHGETHPAVEIVGVEVKGPWH